MDIKSKTKLGIIWNLTERLGNQILRFILGIILARLLLPADYGLIGLTSIIIIISDVMIEGGWLMALIQKKNNTDEEYSTVFWYKMAITIVAYAFIFAGAGIFAEFYEIEELNTILKVISLTLLISTLGSIHRIKLINELNFRLQAKITLIGTLIGGLSGIYLAFKGYGVWALVFQNLIINLVQTILFWIFAGWIPSFTFSRKFLKTIFKITYLYFGSNILLIIYNNLYVAFIGKLFGASTLGYYNRALQFEQMPENTVNSVIVKVFFPVLSEVKNDLNTLKEQTLNILSWLSFIITPLMIMIILNSKQIIRLLLTEKWEGASDLMIIICIAGIFIPLSNTLLNIFNVLGKPIVSIFTYGFKIIFSSILIFSVWKYGINYVVSIFILENIMVFLLLAVYSNREISLSLLSTLKSVGFVFLLNILALAVVIGILYFFNLFSLNNLPFIIASSTIYLTSLLALGKLLNFKQIEFLTEKLKPKK